MLLHALLQKRKAHLPSETSSRDFVRPWENEPGALPCEKTEEWFNTFWGNVLAETDRGVVLVIAMVLDECVDRIHQAHLLRNFDNPERQFKRLSSQSGPLGSLASRILLAVGFGLIDDFIFYQLELIRVFRNYLAHESGMFSFASPGAIELVSKMRYDEMREMVNQITAKQPKDPVATEVMRDFALKCAARHQRLKLVESDAPLDAASTFILCGLSLNMLLWNRETDLKIQALKVHKIL
jgi:DNA-binding MltR family transcriptional regulator